MGKSKVKNTNEVKNELFSAMFRSGVLKDESIVATVPIGNEDAVQTLFADMQPAEFVNEVLLGENHPTDDWSGNIILTLEWAKSFAEHINTKPGPLYARGHEDAGGHWAMRAIPSGYIIGAKVEEGDNPRLLLRNRLLMKKNEMEKEFVEQTMREIAAGMLSTSTGDIQKRRIEFTDDGDFKSYAIESIRGQTNALVEHDMHASEAQIVSSNFKLGYYDKNDNYIQTNLGGQPNSVVDRKIHQEGEETMKFTELVENIKTSFKNGEGDQAALLSALGLKAVTEEDVAMLARAKTAEEKAGKPIDEFVNAVLEERKSNFASVRDAKLKDAFAEPEVFALAKDLFRLNEGDAIAIEEEVTRLKSLESVKTIQTTLAAGVGHVMTTPNVNKGTESTNQTNGVVEV